MIYMLIKRIVGFICIFFVCVFGLPALLISLFLDSNSFEELGKGFIDFFEYLFKMDV